MYIDDGNMNADEGANRVPYLVSNPRSNMYKTHASIYLSTRELTFLYGRRLNMGKDFRGRTVSRTTTEVFNLSRNKVNGGSATHASPATL